ncbi:Reverse transcriptase (RNA-dependent DNA polymerase) [Popillia japonica]|uniref:Reverse transcriptase (RNA-dependent DNA polymerase) n=1 Tax=Popillia japonica TaxID=7064 RepID=A0AAW1MSQ4_POPJA
MKKRTKIILEDEVPIHQQPRRLSLHEMKEVDKQLEEWLQQGVIRPSASDFASPIVLVKKKDGTTRICIDYRKLNRKIIKDRYPLPIIEDQIDKLANARIFTTLDLRNGFFHVPVTEDSVKYTSFVTPHGQYEFLKTPFGLCNAPAAGCISKFYIESAPTKIVTPSQVSETKGTLGGLQMVRDDNKPMIKFMKGMSFSSMDDIRMCETLRFQ